MNETNRRTFSAEEIRMLLDMERRMDRGEIPWVYVEGTKQRLSMDDELMRDLGLEIGQTISGTIFTSILHLKLERLNQEIAWRAAQPLIEEVAKEEAE